MMFSFSWLAGKMMNGKIVVKVEFVSFDNELGKL